MARWAVSGGSGFLGLHLLRRLLAGGHEVCSLDLEPLDAELLAAGARGLVGDIRDPRAAVAVCAGAQVLVHTAAALPIRGSEATIRSVGVGGTATLLAAAADAGVRRVIFVSSAVVYGLPRTLPLTEVVTPDPFEPYGETKLEAEAICHALGRRGLETVVLRPTAFIGPGRLGAFGILFLWIREGRRIYTLGPGVNRYQLLDVGDLVEAILLAGEHAEAAGRTFVLGAAAVAPVREELDALIAHAGSASRVTPVPAGAARSALAALSLLRLSPLSQWHYRTADKDFFVDSSAAQSILGWKAERSTLETLIRAYDWCATHRAPERAGSSTHRVRWDERALGLVRRLS